MKWVLKVLRYLFLIFIITLCLASFFVSKKFELFNFGQLIYHLTTSLEGTSNSFFIEGLKSIIVYLILGVVGCFVLIHLIRNYDLVIKSKKKKEFNIFSFIYKFRILIDIVLSIGLVFITLNNLKFFDYMELINGVSSLYEEEYVDPRTANIDFDGKRNLIMIYVESLESTDFSKENGGYRNKSLITNLENIYVENYGISTNYYSLGGATWTIAGMFASTSGLPYKAEFANDFAKLYGDDFLPGSYTLGDYLNKYDYNQVFLMGSDDKFGSRDVYLKKHGNFEIIDYDVIKEKYNHSKAKVNDWGYDDSYIFDLAKDKLLELSKSDKPFNLSLLTSNTHPIDGSFDKSSCIYNKKYTSLENAYMCEDIIVSNFIKWVTKQDFYKNTTIVIVGDHLAMYRESMGSVIPEKSSRSLYAAIMNSKVTNTCSNESRWSTVDLYPTILASMGAQIEGDRLGLGTNLFSCKETIVDKYDSDLDRELTKSSVFYDDCIMNDQCNIKESS